MEYDKNMLKRSLVAFGFNIDELSLDNIIHVPMHEWRTSTNEQTQLYVDNLQCCVGLYAYGNNFGFAAHINPVVVRNNEYEFDKEGKLRLCTRCYDLLREIVNSKRKIVEPFNIGISLGSTPLYDYERPMALIYEALDEIVLYLKKLGYPVNELDKINESSFILDTKTGQIIAPNDNIKEK